VKKLASVLLAISLAISASSIESQANDTSRRSTTGVSGRGSAPRGDTIPKRKAPFWPDSVRGPAARPGALLPNKRVVAFYGNPLSTRMGILGQLPPAQMFTKLEATVAMWAEADTMRTVQPALELIATVAQASGGRDGLYRLRMGDSTIERVYKWARDHGWLLILDIQVGHSDIMTELEVLRKYLIRPDVHLAIDPEFDMRPGHKPGKYMGTTDADDINKASDALAAMVNTYQLPPKLLIVHRFTKPMVTRSNMIKLDPRVQVVMHMDGYGSPGAKKSSHAAYIEKEPVQWVGFKLFFKNDHPMLTPAEVLKIKPIPLFISYQ
jgi:hypothetical protein